MTVYHVFQSSHFSGNRQCMVFISTKPKVKFVIYFEGFIISSKDKIECYMTKDSIRPNYLLQVLFIGIIFKKVRFFLNIEAGLL